MMKVKKIPLRSCVITKERLPKQELLRIVKTKEQEVKVDPTGKMNGRGAYIKKDKAVLEKAKKTKALAKHLEIEIPDEVYQEIEQIIEEGVNNE